MYYLAIYYKVDGTYYGEQVSGYVYVENLWANYVYGDNWWTGNRVGHWIFWSTEYADGTQEYGQFLCGEYGARGAAIANNRGEEVLNTNQINAFEKEDATGNTEHIRYEFANGEQFEYIDDPTYRVPIGATGTSLGGGYVKRVGEKREIVRSNAIQLVAGKMCDPVTLKPEGTGSSGGSCSDSAAPLSRFVRRNVPRWAQRSAPARPQHATAAAAAPSASGVGRPQGRRRCAFLRRNGSFTKPRSCRKAIYLKARGKRRWRLGASGRACRPAPT